MLYWKIFEDHKYFPSTLRYWLFLTVFVSRDGHLRLMAIFCSKMMILLIFVPLGLFAGRERRCRWKRGNVGQFFVLDVLYWSYSYVMCYSRVAERRQSIWLRNHKIVWSRRRYQLDWPNTWVSIIDLLKRTCCSVVAGISHFSSPRRAST